MRAVTTAIGDGEPFTRATATCASCRRQMTTVVDLSADTPRLVREGKGDTRPFGFVKEALH